MGQYYKNLRKQIQRNKMNRTFNWVVCKRLVRAVRSPQQEPENRKGSCFGQTSVSQVEPSVHWRPPNCHTSSPTIVIISGKLQDRTVYAWRLLPIEWLIIGNQCTRSCQGKGGRFPFPLLDIGILSSKQKPSPLAFLIHRAR